MDSNSYPTLSPEERDVIVRTVMGEAASDPASQAGVAAVIANRMRQTGSSASQIVLAPNQFEPWTSRSHELMSYSPDSDAYKSVAGVVDGVFGGGIPDPTNGATNFYSPTAQAAMGRAPPSWDNGTGIDIGQHRFFGGAPAKAMSDEDIGSMYGGPANAKPMSDDDIGDMYGGPGTGQPLTVPVKTGDGVSYLPPVGSAASPQDPGEYFDRTAPISQQLGTAARQTASYVGGQIAGIPSAIASDFRNSQSLAVEGMDEAGAGNLLPSFPSGDPRTWAAGGILKTLAGMAGQLSSPVSGIVHQLVEDPVTQATGSPQSGQMAGVLASTMAPAALGAAGAATGNALASGIVGNLSPEIAALADLARTRYGIPVNAGQMSEAPGVQFASSALNRLPFSGAGANADAQQLAFNRAVSNTFGQASDRVTPDVMAAARARIGQAFNDVAAHTSIQVDPQMLNDLRSTMQDATSVLPQAEMGPIRNQVQNLVDTVDQATGQISGDSYQALTRKGAPLDRAMNSSDPNVKFYAGQIKDALDGALERSTTPDLQTQLQTARLQYKNMKTVEDLVEKSPTGKISPALLMGAVRQSFSNMAYGGGGDLGDLARIGQKFLKEPPSSGTAERASTLAGLSNLARGAFYGGSAIAAPFFIPHYVPGVSPLEAMLPAATVPATLAAGRAVGGALRSNALADAMINRGLGRIAPRPTPLPLAALFGLGTFASGQTPSNALLPQQ